MINDQKQSNDVETISLRALVSTVFKSWVLLLILMVLGGLITGTYHFLRKPVFTATSVVSIDSSLLLSGITPIFALQDDSIKESVAKELNMSVKDLPEVTITSDKTDKTISKISVQSGNPQLAMDTVNHWADLGVLSIKNNLVRINADLENANTEVTKTSAAIANFLQVNNLNDLTWYDLVALTGIGSSDNLTIGDNSRVLPNISSKQRLELGELIRQKGVAEWNYSRISQNFLLNNYQVDLRLKVLNRATKAEDESILGSVLIIPLGVFAGLFIALIWILFKDWWKSSSLPVQEKQN